MDIQPTSQQPISDDQELAKVLAGVNQQAEEAAATQPPAEPVVPEPTSVAPIATEEPVVAPVPEPVADTEPALSQMPPASGDLESIKQEALGELRPLVDKLNVSS